MRNKTAYLILVLAIILSVTGCAGGNKLDLTPEQRDLYSDLTKMAVYEKIYVGYGPLEPGITIDDITAEKIDGPVYPTIIFDSKGSYTIKDESGVLYSGTFKVRGHSEGHGSGWDSCEMTKPKNGFSTLPERSMVSEQDIPESTTAETTVLTLDSDVMIRLSKKYENDGYSVRVLDPAEEFEGCYGAIEHFMAYDEGEMFDVYLYDSREAAENAEFMMFGDGSDRVKGVGATTKIVEDSVLVASYRK